ncbi:hypothetical protein BY996DRAFT_3185447 [Phakopsora pachyrhizi]|nr:hypothetical protein BY996DRAFT_3185447 [Phakopsora pachyrhizi]
MMLNSRIARSNELAIKYFDEIKCNNERLRILNEWRFKVDLNGRLRNFSFKVENKLMFLGLKRWNYLVSMERLSLKFWVKSKQREVWRVWRRGIKRFKKLHKRANRVISIRDENLASRILYFWIINERGQLLGRIILTRLLRLMISRWMTKLDRVRFYLDAGQQVFRKKLIRREQLKILRRWKNLTIKYQRNLVNQADDRYLISSKAIHFNQWMISFERMRVLSIKAKSHRNFLDLNSRFQSWFVKFRRIRIMKLIKNRKEREIKRVFLEWNFITKRKIKEDSVIFEFNKKLQSNKVLISLRIWRRRLIHLKDLRKKSERQFYDKILKFGLGNWIKKYLKAIEIRDIGLAFFEIQNIVDCIVC